MRFPRRVACLVGAAAWILGVIVAPGGVSAQETRGAFPEKNGHVFVPTTFIPDPFVNTELTLGMGYSNTIDTEIPLFTSAGQQIGTVKGDLLFMNGNLEFNCALRDWIGFFTRVNVLARSGSNTASIFANGLSAGSGFGVGWEFRLRESDRSILSGSVALDRATVTLIDVATFVDNPDRGLSRTFTPLVGAAQARYAYGLSDLVGLSAYGGLGLGENPAKDYDNTWFWQLGGVASVNLARRRGVPLGFALGARTSSYPITFDNADGNTWAGLASVAYMGRPDLAITLDTVYEYVPVKYEDVALGYLGFTVGLTYEF
jgi:hypothetical protein